MTRHKHRFVATPITGQNNGTGKEGLLGFKLECDVCYKLAAEGDRIVEVKKSWLGEVIPEAKPIDYIVGK